MTGSSPGLCCPIPPASRRVGLTIPRSVLTEHLSLGASHTLVGGVVENSRSQEPRGTPNPGRVGSWIIPAPEGAYGPVVAWTSGEAWFDAVLDALATPEAVWW